jgi:lysophospholipase L1-like esterase
MSKFLRSIITYQTAAAFILGVPLGFLAERGLRQLTKKPNPVGYNFKLWSPDTQQWKTQVRQQVRRSTQFDGISLFMGDSLTFGMAVSNLPFKAENFGINGDTVVGLAARVPRYSYKGVDRIYLQIGVNDWQRDRWHSYEADYRKVLAALPAGVPLVLQSLTPTGVDAPNWFNTGLHTASLKAENERLRLLCAARRNCSFIDLATPLSGADGHLLPAYDSGDGIHLTSCGYEAWRAVLNGTAPPACGRTNAGK